MPNRLTTTILLLLTLYCFHTANAKVVDQITAYVNDDVITVGDLNRLLNERSAELQQIYRIPKSEADEKANQEQAALLDKLIREMLIVQEAQRQKIEVEDAEVEKVVNSRINTYKEGLILNFLMQRIQRAQIPLPLPKLQKLVSVLRKPSLMAEITRQMETEEDPGSSTEVFATSATEVKEFIDMLKQLEDIGIASIDDLKERADEELNKALKREGYTLDEYKERTRKELIGEKLVQQMVLPRVEVLDRDIDTFFEENRGKFTTKMDRVHLRHIFAEFKVSESVRKAAEQKANRILEEAQSGADFADLARQYTENQLTKETGGYLGWLTIDKQKQLPKPFQDAVSKLEVGQIAGPVEGQDGLHILKLEDRAEENIELRHILIALEPDQNTIEAAKTKMNDIADKLKNGADFAELATQYSDDTETKVKGGELGARGLEDFTEETRKVINELEEGQVSEPVETQYGLHIFKLDKREKAQLTDEERNEIRLLLRQQRFEQEWQKYTDKLKEKAFVKVKTD